MGFNRDWLLRIALAAVFLFHGIGKFIGDEGVGGFAQMMGLPLFVAYLVAFAEVAGGLAIIPVMLGAIFMVHWGRWNFATSESHPMGGMEFQVVLLLIATWFALGNGGRASDS